MTRALISSLFAGIAMVALAGTAQAADLPARGETFIPAPSAVYDWSGFYVGLNGGYGSGSGNVGNNGDGGFVGGQLGFTTQFGRFVFGLEGDVQGAWIDDNFTLAAGALGAGLPLAAAGSRVDLDWFGTLRGRVGFAFDRFMVYATGGGAWADYSARIATLGADSNMHWGYTVGGGAEVALWNRVSAKVEYKYLQFDRENYALGPLNVPLAPDMHTISLGLNYRF